MSQQYSEVSLKLGGANGRRTSASWLRRPTRRIVQAMPSPRRSTSTLTRLSLNCLRRMRAPPCRVRVSPVDSMASTGTMRLHRSGCRLSGLLRRSIWASRPLHLVTRLPSTLRRPVPHPRRVWTPTRRLSSVVRICRLCGLSRRAHPSLGRLSILSCQVFRVWTRAVRSLFKFKLPFRLLATSMQSLPGSRQPSRGATLLLS